MPRLRKWLRALSVLSSTGQPLGSGRLHGANPRRPAAILLLGVLSPVLQTDSAPAAPGALDTSFNGTGMARHALWPGEEAGMAVAWQADGKVVAAGYCQNGAYYEFFAARYNTDGSPDASFGTQGSTMIHINDMALCSAVQIQTDGKIVLAGDTYDAQGRTRFAVARLNADGTVDNTFGLYGIATAAFNSVEDHATSLVIQPDGRVVVAGTSFISNNSEMSVARFTSTGGLDTSFDGDGKAVVSFGSSSDVARAVSLQAIDGKIILAGSTDVAGGHRVALARLNSNGSLDTAFDGDGKLVTTLAGFATAVTREPAIPGPRGEGGAPEKFVVAGSLDPGYTVFVARYNLSGNLDATFDGDGLAVRTFTEFPSIGNVFVTGGTTSRKITAGGWLQIPGSFQRMLLDLRFTENGALDTSFDSDGIATITPGLGCEGQGGMAVNGANRVVHATTGYASATDWGLQVVRLAANGPLDPTFDEDGLRFDNIGIHDSIPGAVAVLSDDRILAVGSTWEGEFVAARYLTNGALDPTFGSGGAVKISSGANSAYGSAMVLQADGRIVMAGTAGSSQTSSLVVCRLLPDGATDPSFSGDGRVTVGAGVGWNSLGGVAIQPDGKILLAGTCEMCDDFFCQATYMTVLLMRLNPDGSTDGTFGSGGAVTVPLFQDARGRAVALQADGKIVVAGQCTTSNRTYPMVARYTSTGQLDTSFNGSGVTYASSVPDGYANAVRLQPDGGILVAGTGQVSVDGDYILLKYTSTGALDTTFGLGGIASASFGILGVDIAYGLALQPDGRILATGRSQQSSGNVISAARFTAAGALDGAFGNGGKVLIDFSSPSDVGRSLAIDSFGRIVILGDAGGLFGVVRLVGDDVSAVGIPDSQDPSGVTAVGPNPFQRETRVSYRLDREAPITLRVFTASGALVTTLVDGTAGPGQFEETWTGRDDRGGLVPSGVYFMRLEAGGRASTRRVVYLR